MPPILSFLGAARTVTGSQFLIEGAGKRVLVDCGMAQGSRIAEGINQKPFSFDPTSLDAVIITHAHIDHTGKLPKLVKEGFRGPIFCTPPTKEFAEILLRDSASLIWDEAQNRGETPLFTNKDVEEASGLFETVPYHERREVASDFSFTLYDAGHVLGSAVVVVEVEGKTIAFSGDLGNPPTPLLRPTEILEGVDYVVIESTYGGRLHEPHEERSKKLEMIIDRVIEQKGTLLMPIFAFEKAQEILFEINKFVEQKKIPHIPVFIDSPLAIDATGIYEKYPEYYNSETRKLMLNGDDPFGFPGLVVCRTPKESKKINDASAPKIIIAGSGMMTGGRVLHHAIRYLPEQNSILLFVGYQAAGSLGRRIFDGARSVRIMDKNVPVNCLVKGLGAYSSHADQDGLAMWIDNMKKRPVRIFVTHGEEASALALRQRLRDDLGLDVEAPFVGDRAAL